MRVAALYDIHGNLPALEAVLDDVRSARVDRIVAGGDVVVGPMSRDAVRRLLDCGIPVDFIRATARLRSSPTWRAAIRARSLNGSRRRYTTPRSNLTLRTSG